MQKRSGPHTAGKARQHHPAAEAEATKREPAADEKPQATEVTEAPKKAEKVPRPVVRRPTPPELADVALIDGPSIAAAGCMALSVFHDLVRTGDAPQPVLRGPRCTRWRLVEAREWLKQRAERGSDPAAVTKVMKAARDASGKAREKRIRDAAAAASTPEA
jgi:predicted DNA-binding transcriptional regulator AlpA